jgi:FAD dependent oxidoreductase
VQGAARIMPYCFAMGEAAGLATVLALEQGGDVRAIDTDVLRAQLRAQGAYLPE